MMKDAGCLPTLLMSLLLMGRMPHDDTGSCHMYAGDYADDGLMISPAYDAAAITRPDR